MEIKPRVYIELVHKMIKRKLKRLLIKVSGIYPYLKKSINCESTWYGNEYGGFYVCPAFINENSIVYSFGIGEDISFDRAIIENCNCKVFGFDPTPKSINWVNNQQLPLKFSFYKFGINNTTGIVDFYLPKNPNHVSGSSIIQDNIDMREKLSVNMKTINDIVRELGHSHIDILKMDIEGSEYEVIDNILSSKIIINQILIEFHERFFKKGKLKTQDVVKKLNRHGFEIFAVSDTYQEVSFINKRLLS